MSTKNENLEASLFEQLMNCKRNSSLEQQKIADIYFQILYPIVEITLKKFTMKDLKILASLLNSKKNGKKIELFNSLTNSFILLLLREGLTYKNIEHLIFFNEEHPLLKKNKFLFEIAIIFNKTLKKNCYGSASSTFLRNESVIENNKKLKKIDCFCKISKKEEIETDENNLINCKSCDKIFHKTCNYVQEFKKELTFECPECLLTGYNPLNQIIKKITSVIYFNNEITTHFDILENELKLKLKKKNFGEINFYIEIRCICLTSENDFLPEWPENTQLIINKQIIKQFQQKYRFTNIKIKNLEYLQIGLNFLNLEIVKKEKTLKKSQTVQNIFNESYNKEKKILRMKTFALGVYLIKEIKTNQLIEELINKSNLTVDNSLVYY